MPLAEIEQGMVSWLCKVKFCYIKLMIKNIQSNLVITNSRGPAENVRYNRED